MAKNRHSTKGCPTISKFDNLIKENFFPSFSVAHLSILRGIFQDDDSTEAKEQFALSMEINTRPNTEDEEELRAHKENFDWEEQFEAIDDKLRKGEQLSEEDNKFVAAYKQSVQEFLNDEELNTIVTREMKKAGAQTLATSKMHELFKNKIPAGYRNEVSMQLCAIVIKLLDRLETMDKYKHFTRTEIIDYYSTTDGSNHLTGFNAIMSQARKMLSFQYKQLKELDKQTKESENKQGYTMSAEAEAIFDALLNDDDAWMACVYETKSKLLEAEKIKIGNTVEYVEDVDDDDINNANTEDEYGSAEEEGPEHWQLKADTISSFNSMAREVRSLLYKITTGQRGILGFSSIIDTMRIHQNLMELRGEKFCQNSAEFMQALLETKTTWGQQLYDILKKDPYKRTSVFNAYRRNHLNYVYHRESRVFDKDTGTSSIVFYRNKSGKDTRVLLGAYAAEVTHIDKENKICLFNADGSINEENKNKLFQILNISITVAAEGGGTTSISVWDDIQKVYRVELFGSTVSNLTEEQILERKRNFINTMNLFFNLHLHEEDVNILMDDDAEFKGFCGSIHSVEKALKKGANRRHSKFTSLLENPQIRRVFERLIKNSKHTITIQERNSPIEKAFRYNKSTYMAHTVPSSIGDNLEKLGKKASEGLEAFKSYLEETYLCCPALATKTADGKYIIYNGWLKALYNSTEEDLKNPASFVNRFINGLTRGLGTDSTAFVDFAEKDNLIFSLNEYLQTKVETGGSFGVTPLFITGDSNSTRYLTTPIMSSDDEIINGMVENVIQEIERMRMFDSFISFLDSNNLKLSEGHAGKTIREWMQEDEERRPSILKNRDKFTFFPFLNEHKSELFTLYEEAEKLDETTGLPRDPAKIAFRTEARKLLIQELSKKYEDFIESLQDKGIVSKVGEIVVLNPNTLDIKGLDGKSVSANDVDLIRSFYLNTKYNLIQQLQFLTIDPGFYKNTEDLQKRFKENIASGELLDLEAIDPSDPTGTSKIDDNNGYQSVAYIDEMLTDLDTSDEEGGSAEDRAFMEALRKAGFPESVVGNSNTGKKGKYNKNTLTDGQGYRSFTSYRKLMIMRGEPHWTKAHEEVYQIIKANREAGRTRLSKQDYQRILDLGVVFQPLKPFYYGFEELEMADGSKTLIPVQHKYSEFPIIPELLPEGCRLGELGRAMEEGVTGDDGITRPIDLVCCTTCVKVGGFGSSNVRQCKTSDDFKSTLKTGHMHQLKLEGWRQQSNVPEHVDSSRARGTQFTKHGYGGLSEAGNKAYNFIKRVFTKGKIRLTKNVTIDVTQGLNQQNLIQLYGALGSAGYIHSALQLKDKIDNPREASNILSELRANDSRGAKDNIAAYSLDDNGETLMSPAEGMMAVDNMASLLSILRKDVIKQPIKGGSAVQVSAYGFEDVLKVHTDPENKNIIYADCAGAFAFSVTTETGEVIDLSSRYLDFVDPDTGMLLDEDNKGVEPLEPTGKPGEEFYGWNTKLGKLYPGILDLIAYRIPTEKDYSIINLKFKRFFPKTAGGILMVPSQFTTVAGFDFDIDKLYFIRREYKYKKLPSISNYDVWSDFYAEHPIGKKIHPYLIEAREAALRNEEGALFLGKNDYQYWGVALDRMEAAGEDISDIPKEASEAFSRWIASNVSRYTELISNYDESKTVLENSQAAVNNLFFDYMQARLEDYDTFQERYTPGGFQQLKDYKPVMMAIRYGSIEDLVEVAKSSNPEAALLKLAKEKFNDFSPNYDPTEISTIAHYQTFNALYDKLIGVAANQNINQRLTALLNKLELNNAIQFGSLVGKTGGEGKDIKARVVNGMDTELLTTEFLAAAVDAVKDALLEFYGMDDKNFNIACLFAKIGCTPMDIGLLLNQPVVVRAMNIIKEGRGFKNLTTALNEALEEMIEATNYREEKSNFYPTLYSEGVRDKYVDTNSLIKYIAQEKLPTSSRDTSFIRGQLAVIHLMEEAQAAAQELAEQVNISKTTSTNSVKSTIGAIQAVLQKAIAFSAKFGGKDSMFRVELMSQLKTIINPLLRFDKSNAENVLGMCIDSPYCMEQIAFSALMGYAESLGNYFPYFSDGFTLAASSIANLTNRGYLTAEIFDAHNKAAMQFFLERMVDAFNESNTVQLTNAEGDTLDTKVPSRVFYNVLFPMYLDYILNHNDEMFKAGKTNIHYLDIPILGSISREIEGYGRGADVQHMILKMENIGGLQNGQKDNLIESWESMFNSDDPILRDLAEHLFMYSYYNRGFDFGPTTFMSLVPLVVKRNIGREDSYAEFFNRVFNLKNAQAGMLMEANGNTDSISLKEYAKAFILVNRNKFYQFTKKVYAPKRYSEDSAYARIQANMPEDKSRFTVTIGEEKDNPIIEQLCIKYQKDPQGNIISRSFIPLVEINGAVYMCDNNINASDNVEFNIIGSGTLTYYRMDTPIGNDYSTPTLYGTKVGRLSDANMREFIQIVSNIGASMTSYEVEAQTDEGISSQTVGSTYTEHPLTNLISNLQHLNNHIDLMLKKKAATISEAQLEEGKNAQILIGKMLINLSGEVSQPLSENTRTVLSKIVEQFMSASFLSHIKEIEGTAEPIFRDIWKNNFESAMHSIDSALGISVS